ncbi:hypothetical protein BGZ83_008799 [Gryganskiella cystojenkinii]|nr:hypothetical protein BGZ83_008799 [Gryganskiella cystojenkinii]
MADAVLAESRLFWKLVIEPTIFQEYFCTPVIRVFESEPEPCSQPGHFWSCIFTETMINSWVTIEIEIKRIRIAGIPPKLHNRRRHRHHSDDDRNEHEYHDDEERYDQIPGPSLQPRSKHPSPSGNGLENEDDGGTPIRTQYKTTIALHTPQKLAPVMYLFLNDDATSDADSILNRNKYELEFVITEEIPTYQVPSPSSCHRILDTLFHDIVVTVKPDPVTADIFFEFPVEKNLGAASRSYSSSSSQESPQSNSSTSSSHYRREDYRHGIVTVAAHEHILSRFPKIAAWIERERMTQVEARIRQLEEKSRIAREQQNMWRPVSYPTLTLLTNSKQFNIDGNGNSDTPLPIRNDELREGGQSGGCDYHYNELSQTPFPEQQRATAVGHPSTSTASMPPHPVSAAFFSTPPPLRRTSRDVESEHGDPYELDSNSQKVQRTSHHPQHLDHQHNQQQQFIQPQYQHPHLLQQQQQEQEQQQQRHHPRWLQEHRSWEQEVQQQRQQGEQQRWQPQQYEEQPRFQQQQQEEEEVLEYEARARDHFLSHLLDQPCAHVALTTAQYPHQYPYEQCDHPRQHEYHLQSCPHYQQTERDSSLVSPLPSFNLPAPLPRSCEEFQPLPSILRIPVRDISVATFQAMLQYLYTGEIGISEEQAFEIHVDLNDNAEDHPFDSVDSLTPPPAGSPAVPAYRQDPVLSAGTGGTNDIQPHTSIILPPIGIQSQTSRYPTKPSFSRRLFSFEQCDVRRLPNQQGSGISDEQTTAFYPQLLGAPALSWPVYKPTSSSTFTSWLPCSRLNRNSRLGQRGGSDVPSGRTVSGGNENNNQGHGGTEGSVSSDSCTGNGAFERISRYNGYNDTISVRRASFSALPSSSSFSESDHRCSWESLLLMAWKFALRDLEGLAKKAMAIRSSINYTDMAKATHSRFDEINMDLQLAWSEQVLCEFLKLYNPPFVRVRRDGHGILTEDVTGEASGPKGQKYPDCELTILEFCQELRSRYFRIRNILDGE